MNSLLASALVSVALLGPLPETGSTLDVILNDCKDGCVLKSWEREHPILDAFKYEMRLHYRVSVFDYLGAGYEAPEQPMYRFGRRPWKPLPGSRCPCGCWIIALHHAAMMQKYEITFPRENWWMEDDYYGYWRRPDPPVSGRLGYEFVGIKY